MSNDELTKHAIRTSADLLELTEKIDDIKSVQDAHTQRFDAIDQRFEAVDERFDAIDERLNAHIAASEDHFRKLDANTLEIRDLLATFIAKSS